MTSTDETPDVKDGTRERGEASSARDALLSLAAELETQAADFADRWVDDAAQTLRGTADLARERAGQVTESESVPTSPLPDGEWLEIAFVGHIEYRGAYVREVTRNGQPAYRVELPDYVFGGDRSAVRHHAASSWFGDQPVSEASVRKAWDAEQARAEERRKREAEWERQQAERALPAGAKDSAGNSWQSAPVDDRGEPF